MEADRVVEPAPVRGDQNHSSPRAGHHYGPIEVHRLVLMGDIWGRELDFHPFGDEVGKSLRLNSGAGDIPDVVAHELKSPVGDLANGIVVTDNLPKWVQGDDHDLVVGEVVQELLGRHQHGVQKLLHLGVSSLSVGEYLTDEVHRSLNLHGVSQLLPFDDEGGAHNVVVCRDVEEEGFSPFGSNEDWGRC